MASCIDYGPEISPPIGSQYSITKRIIQRKLRAVEKETYFVEMCFTWVGVSSSKLCKWVSRDRTLLFWTFCLAYDSFDIFTRFLFLLVVSAFYVIIHPIGPVSYSMGVDLGRERRLWAKTAFGCNKHRQRVLSQAHSRVFLGSTLVALRWFLSSSKVARPRSRLD